MIKTTLHNLIASTLLTGVLFASQQLSAQVMLKPTGQSSAKKETKLPLKGIVTDAATKKGIGGVNITVKNFSAAITDGKGEFTINVPSYTADIEIVAEGYDTKVISLKGRNTINAALLSESSVSFQEQVVLPFGSIAKRNSTAAVAGYDANSSWNRPFETPDALLQGQVSGLHAIRRSGTPGVGANLFLRGYNSLYATNSPLFVIDGMVYDVNDYGKSIIENNYTNPLSLINVGDIDNYTIIKDASSIYGTKGANGAIIITTSRAKQEATNIDFGVYTSFNQAPDFMPVMDANNYRTYLNEMLQSRGLSAAAIGALPYMIDDSTNNKSYYRYHNNTNWQKNVFSNSMNQNLFLKVTGGDNIAKYALSVGYSQNEGVIKNTDLKRYNTRFNAAFNFSKKFTGVANLAFTYNENNLKYQGVVQKTAPLYGALTKSPFLTAYELNEKGIFSPNLDETDVLGFSNPSVLIENMQAYNRYYRFLGSYKFNYDISNSISASTLFGVVYDKIRENIFVPRKGVADDTTTNAIIDSRLGTQVKRLFSIYSDSRLEFKKTYNLNHNVLSRLGVRYQHNKAEQDYTLGYNSATDELISVQNGNNALRQTGGGIGEWNWMNAYFNFDYGFKNKLFFSFNTALDGSSRFGKQVANGVNIGGNSFALMPSLGAAWLISSEKFMATSSFDMLKLRINYSYAGNDDIGNYSSRQTYSSQNLLGMQGLVRSGIPNPAIQWETNKKFNVGLDLAFWNERVNLSVDAYRNKTENMLVYENIAAQTGFTNVLTNGGSMLNTGIEAGFNINVVNKKKLRWDIGATVASNKNKILSVPNGSLTTQYANATILTQNNSVATLFYGYTADGVFSSNLEASNADLRMKNSNSTFSPFKGGDVKFKDINGDRIIDEKDREVIGNPTPDFFGSINSRLVFGRFSLTTLFVFSQGNDVYNYLRYKLESASTMENQLNSVVNRWRAEGQSTNMPRATFGDPLGNNRFSTRWIEDGSYLNLRNASLNYAIPFKDKFIKNASIYLSGDNLFTLTKYSGFNPEFSASNSIFAQGIDMGLNPMYKTLTIGARIGL